MTPPELLSLLDNLRDRGVTYVKLSIDGAEIECNLPPRGVTELPLTQAARDELLRDPHTPEEVKKRIAEEDERDLFAAAG